MGLVQDHQNTSVDQSLGWHFTHSTSHSIESPPIKAPRDSVVGHQEGTSSGLEPGDLWELLIRLLIYIFYMWLALLGVSYELSSLNAGQTVCSPLT